MRKVRTVDLMSTYFEEKGRVMDRTDYIRENDGPLSLPAIKRTCGSWSRMLKICERTHPDRMAAARAGKTVPPPPPPAPPPPAPTPKVETGSVTTAAEALRRVREKRHED